MTDEERKEIARAKRREYYAAHREQYAEAARRYRESHREQLNEYHRQYRKRNPDKVKIWRFHSLCRWMENREAAAFGGGADNGEASTR